ncbi:electron transfer flavoprotein subunit beta/FixA family protein [Arthrobacter sp. Y-9]|uniref:electron transfer flavoprotein subunit beta/FixA family protein n=1 Tax=Arthrobacter sp. Y-9 TaxID=3039385 RepID=UPI001B2F2192|nr:electron transfer flavoprotein subunit beta/FixA family protein [Arthrobacter sp. Y-9]MBO9704048.1 electron transfer flavoprotein subunit beta/FixA family protein [Arthrobacter sp.]WFR83129.1 electron transfer flavoprotein subunit beta/FixA family protein [Arthrobacter sp. Y-9]
MKIVVLVKHVPDAQFERHLSGPGHTVDRSESILSELDEYALEAALQISEANGGEKGGNTVIALTMGADGASNSIKKSLQIGASEGYHLSDPALAGSDAAATSLALAAAIQRIAQDGPVDLVIGGMASTDGETSLVPAQLAERLGWAYVGHAKSLDVNGATVAASREVDGFAETLEASLPAVVSVTDQINEPRYPNFKGIIAAKRKKTHPLALGDLGLEAASVGAAGSLTVLEDAQERPARTQGTIITDEGDAGIKLVEFLAAEKLI